MKTFLASFLVVASFGLTTAASAQGTSQQRSDCMGDAFSFCASSIPNVSKIEACLKRNVASLSPSCRAEFEPAGKTRLKRRHFRT